jgi:hypothetical protein
MTSADPASSPSATPLIHPFVALMKRYAIDYTNAHDQSIYPELFVDDYTVNIGGVALVRDESYGPAVRWLYDRAPGLGLVVHELVLNGDRLCMRFSEHASMPLPGGGRALSCWRGIGMYAWNGERLVSNWVEQDFLSRRRQLETGEPDALEPPHLDPWVTTVPVPPDAAAEATARAAVTDDRLHEATAAHIDDRVGDAGPLVVEPDDVTINDSFSAGRRVAVHATVRGSYRGGVLGVADQAIGRKASLQVVALVDVDADGSLREVRAVTDREGVRAQLRAAD